MAVTKRALSREPVRRRRPTPPARKLRPKVTYPDLVRVASDCVTAIRKDHPEIPENIPVVIGSRGRRPLFGYFQHDKWITAIGRKHTVLPEIGLSAEDLNRPARHVFNTILHECVHASCAARELKDTSQRGRYHNGVFAREAEAFGCKVTKDDQIGCRTPDIQAWAHKRYRKQIDNLLAVMKMYRQAEPDKKKPKDRNLKLVVCTECGAKARASDRTLEEGLYHGDGGDFEIVNEPPRVTGGRPRVGVH